MRTGRNPWLTAFAVLIYAFLFAPIVILIIFSFNVSRRNFVWLGFTTDWYPKLFANQDLLDALVAGRSRSRSWRSSCRRSSDRCWGSPSPASGSAVRARRRS